LDTLS